MPKHKYIHGTNSSIFPILARTGYRFMSPMDMLELYGLAPMSGEITQGGLSRPESKCNMCFGLLGNDQGYSKKDIIRNYAEVQRQTPDIDHISVAIRDSLTDNLFNINEVIVLIARAKQWGLDLNAIMPELRDLTETFTTIKQLYYALLCIADYSDPDFKVSYSVSEKRTDIPEIIRHSFSLETLKHLLRNSNLDWKHVYNNPDQNSLDSLAKIFTLPAGNNPAKKAEGEHTVVVLATEVALCKLAIANKGLTKNSDMALDQDEAENIFFGVFKRKERELYHLLCGQFCRGDNKILSQIQSCILKRIEYLEKRYTLLQAIINRPIAEVKLSANDRNFVTDSFPILLVLEQEDLIEERIGQEFRVGTNIMLGSDIVKIATDTQEHKELIHAWIAENMQQAPNLVRLQVLLFDEVNSNLYTLFLNSYRSSNVEELIENICARSTHLSYASPYSLSELYAMSAKVREGYTVGQHTKMVLQEFMQHSSNFHWANCLDSNKHQFIEDTKILMLAIIALHDIGKGLPGEANQHSKTIPILQAYLGSWGSNQAEIRLATNIVGHDLLGGLVVNAARGQAVASDIDRCVDSLSDLAKDSGLELFDFYLLQCLYYLSYAGSYPIVKQNWMDKTDSKDHGYSLQGHKYAYFKWMFKGHNPDSSLIDKIASQWDTDPRKHVYSCFAYIPKGECFPSLTEKVRQRARQENDTRLSHVVNKGSARRTAFHMR